MSTGQIDAEILKGQALNHGHGEFASEILQAVVANSAPGVHQNHPHDAGSVVARHRTLIHFICPATMISSDEGLSDIPLGGKEDT